MKKIAIAACVVLLGSLNGAHAGSGDGGRATLTYTATDMRQGVAGRSIGKGTLTLTTTPAFCGKRRTETTSSIQTVSAGQPQTTTRIPAGQPLILQSLWSSAGQHCLVNNLAFRAEPGAHYRMTTDVDRRQGRCRVRVERRKDGGRFQYVGDLQSLDQICD